MIFLKKLDRMLVVSFSHKQTKYSGIFKGLNEKGHAILDINGKIETFGSINFNIS